MWRQKTTTFKYKNACTSTNLIEVSNYKPEPPSLFLNRTDKALIWCKTFTSLLSQCRSTLISNTRWDLARDLISYPTFTSRFIYACVSAHYSDARSYDKWRPTKENRSWVSLRASVSLTKMQKLPFYCHGLCVEWVDLSIQVLDESKVGACVC